MHRLSVVAAFAAFLAGCGIDDFEEVITDEATLPTNRTAGTPINPSAYGESFKSLQLSQAKEFANQGVKPGDVDAIFVKSIQLEMDTGSTDPSINKLATYVDSMSIWVEAPGQERKVIAKLNPVPATKAADFTVEPDFAPSAADMKLTGLKPYAVAESMQIGADLVLTDAGASPFLNIKLKTTVTLLIDINLLGI